MLMLVFSVLLQLLPTTGYGTWRHLIMPAVTLASYPMAAMARLVRSGMLEVLDADYVRTARAKGVPERYVVIKHALKNAAMPIVTVIGLQFGLLLGGAIVCEMIFAWPGVGRLMIFAINNRDFPLVEASVFVMAMVFILANLLVDLCYALARPAREGPGVTRRRRLPRVLLLAAAPIAAALVCAVFAPQLAPYDPSRRSLGAASAAGLHGRGQRRARPRHRPARPRHPEPHHLRRPDLAPRRRRVRAHRRVPSASPSA